MQRLLEGDQPQIWALEATGRGGLERIGVTREYIKPGDQIKVRCHVLRDGSRGCLLGFLKARDGSVNPTMWLMRLCIWHLMKLRM